MIGAIVVVHPFIQSHPSSERATARLSKETETGTNRKKEKGKGKGKREGRAGGSSN